MSRSTRQPQQTSSQGFNTATSEDDRHDHFDLFHSTNGLTENHQSTTESSSSSSSQVHIGYEQYVFLIIHF